MPSLSEYERLFLLEFYVDYVTIENGSFDNTESKLCVSFRFLHYPVMRVCEEDFNPQFRYIPDEDSKVVFKSGKSCLFSVHPDQDNKISSDFNLVIAVCQTFQDCNERSLIGQAPVNLGQSFTNLLLAASDGPDTGSIVKHDLFPLKDKFKRIVGTVAAFARLSNYGKMIITQFQLADGDMNYMFKGTDQRKLFKDDPMMNPPIIDKKERSSKTLPSAKPCEQAVCRTKPKPPAYGDSLDESSEDSSDESSSEESDESESETESVESTIGDDNKEDKDEYKEIEAEINGHSITIHVARKKKPNADADGCPPNGDQNLQSMPPCCLSQYQPLNPSSTGLEEVNPRISNEDQPFTNEENLIEAISPVCPLADCPMGLYNPEPPPDPLELEAGVVALKGDHVFFQMANRPAGEDINEKDRKYCSSVYYTVGATQAGKETLRNYVQIMPQSPLEPLVDDAPPEGPVSGLPIDSKQDMFLFKVLKENNGVNARCQLEMELRTPKEPYPKPDTNTIDSQCNEEDLPPIEKKGKKGGDGKGKKKKK